MTAALVVIDVQLAFKDPMWGRSDNPDFDSNVGRLIVAWRARGEPIVFVRHDSVEPGSPLRPGNGFSSVVNGQPDLLVSKTVNSAFYGMPDLHEWLTSRSIDGLVICGVQTNHCCETTARMGGNLGYEVTFVIDATQTFDRMSPDGQLVPAEQLRLATATNLHGEFATVVDTDQLLADAITA